MQKGLIIMRSGSLCPLIKYIFSAQSFQALVSHWRYKVYIARNREENWRTEL